jgi:hypothetical protein
MTNREYLQMRIQSKSISRKEADSYTKIKAPDRLLEFIEKQSPTEEFRIYKDVAVRKGSPFKYYAVANGIVRTSPTRCIFFPFVNP